jgi:Hypothetical glycosyl hydrolase family 15
VNAASSRRLVLALVVGLATALLLGRAAPGSAATGVAPTIGALRICTNCVPTGGDLSRYHYVILNAWDAPLIPQLKAANPGLKALVYKNLTFTVDYTCSNGVDSANNTAGVGYCDAKANHPDWFLRDTGGSLIASSGYSSHWLMDVGNPGYQAKWLGNVSSELKGKGWDGVFVDDTDASLDWHLNGRTVARYPSEAAWRSATRSALAAIGPSLQSQGFLVVPNVYAPWKADYDAVATWKDWLQFTSGGAQEYYTKWGMGSAGWLTGNDWTWREQFQQATDAAGKIFLGLTYAPKSDQHSQLFARATFLLMDGGHGGALVFESSDPEAQDPYASSWTADPGSPTGARYQVGSAWRRDFTDGTVVVNPTASPVTVSLGGTFIGADGSSVSSVTLGAASGAILTNPGGPTDPGTGGGSVPPPAPRLTLNASASGKFAKLTWTGSAAAKIDVYRNGRRVARILNTGAFSDYPTKTPQGAYAYRVCEAGGTSVCSDAVTVTFPAAAARAVTGAAVVTASRLHRPLIRTAPRADRAARPRRERAHRLAA